jgi:hypothetical protein
LLLSPIGPLFDSVGRRLMISSTYIISGLLLIVTGVLFVGRAGTVAERGYREVPSRRIGSPSTG